MTEKAQRVQKVLTVRAVDLPQGTSAQPEEATDRWTPEHAIDPPEDLDRLAALTQAARTRRSCIEAVSLNTVGRGFRIVPRDGHEEEATEEEIRELEVRIDAMARRDTRLDRPSFTRLLSAVKWDEEEVGNGYLEVSRNRLTGEIDGLFHAPGKRVRRRKDRTGYVLGPKDGPQSEMVEFYTFGSKVKYSGGKPEARLEGGSKRRWDRNELVPFRIYTSESRDYGLPRDTHLAIDYLGDRRAAQRNASFFDASGVPPSVIFLKPGESDGDEEIVVDVPPNVPAQITKALTADGDRRHRVAVISLPEGVEPDKVDLASLSERDMGFIEFRKDNRRATLGAFRLAPIFVADIEDTNYSTAETEERLTKKQLFDPEQDRWEDILSDSLLRDMGYPHLRFDLVPLEVGDGKQERESADSLADRKALTYGELRKAHGQEPLPEADESAEPEPGQVEHGWNGRLVEVRVGPGATDQDLQRGAEAAAKLLAEGQSAGAVGVEAGA